METYRVHFEIDEFAARQGDDDLSLVDGAFDDGFLAGRLPLVDPLVGADVSDAVGVHLHERVVAERVAAQRRRRAQEPRVRHLLHRLTDRQYKGGVYE